MEKIAERKEAALTCIITPAHGRVAERRDDLVTNVHARQSGLFAKVGRAVGGCDFGDRVGAPLTLVAGFGEHDLDNVLPQFRDLGIEVEMQYDRGESRLSRVTPIADDRLAIDGNHRLAGNTSNFLVAVVDAREASADELSGGPPDAY